MPSTTSGLRFYTSAYLVLDKNLTRTQAFTRIFFAGSTKPTSAMKRGPGKPSDEEKELLRAAVIFSIGALDAYMSEVAAEVLVAQLEDGSDSPTSSARALLRRIAKEVDTLPLELAMTTDATKRRAVVTRALIDHLTSSVSNHGAKAVAATLERMGEPHTGKVWAALDKHLADWPSLATQGRTSAAILDQWTANRHKIVHEGVAVPVNGAHAKELIEFIARLGDEIDRIAIDIMP